MLFGLPKWVNAFKIKMYEFSFLSVVFLNNDLFEFVSNEVAGLKYGLEVRTHAHPGGVLFPY